MTTKIQFALVFCVGLFAGIVVESHVLSSLMRPDRTLAGATTHSVSYGNEPAGGAVGSARVPSLADSPSERNEQSPEPTLAGIPQISVDEPTFNFGDRDAGDMVEHSFKLTNRGDETLLIDRVLTNCGCTSAQLSSTNIPPGESVQLDVKLNLRGQRGPQNRDVMVQSNDPGTPHLKLALVGNAIYHVALSPARVTLDEPEDDKPYATTVSVRADKTIDTFNVERTVTSGDNVEAELETLEPGKHYAVKIKVAPQQNAETFQGWVRLITDHPGEYKVIAIPISGGASQSGNSFSGSPSALPQRASGPTLDVRLGEELEIEGTTIDGAPITLARFEGNPTAVIFWASTCGACRAELGELKQLHADYHDKGFEVLGVSLDKSVERRQEFLNQLKPPWDTVVSEGDGTGIAFARRYNVRAIPSVVLLDRTGKIVAIDKRGEDLRQTVSELISSAEGA